MAAVVFVLPLHVCFMMAVACCPAKHPVSVCCCTLSCLKAASKAALLRNWSGLHAPLHDQCLLHVYQCGYRPWTTYQAVASFSVYEGEMLNCRSCMGFAATSLLPSLRRLKPISDCWNSFQVAGLAVLTDSNWRCNSELPRRRC